MIIPSILVFIAAALNIVGFAGMSGQAKADGYGHIAIWPAQLLYALAGLAFIVAGVLRLMGRTTAAQLAFVAAALAAISGPLVYGALTGQFTLSHHLIRFAVVVAVAVVFLKS